MKRFTINVLVLVLACVGLHGALAAKPSARVELKTAPPLESVAPAEMVTIPAGPFRMGCNDAVDKDCRPEEYPAHEVYLSAFAIDKREVRVADYARCVQAGACTADGLNSPTWLGNTDESWALACNWKKAGYETHPINCVNRSQAEAYCRFVGKRLPSEAEWERAARGTEGRTFPWGNEAFQKSGAVEPRVNMADAVTCAAASGKLSADWCAMDYTDGFPTTAPVGSFKLGATPEGIEDMAGNVAEWTRDNYHREAYKKSAKNNPVWTKPSDSGVLRGGSWYDTALFVRASYRFNPYPTDQVAQGGIRCVDELAKPRLDHIKPRK